MLIGNDTLDAPAGIITLEGKLAAPLLLERLMTAPAAGARPLNFTVPVEDSSPPTTLEVLRLNEEIVDKRGTGGVTASEADLLTPP